MIIEPADNLDLLELEACDFSFVIETEALPPFVGPHLGPTGDVPHTEKTYSFDPRLLAEPGDDVERAILVARVTRLVGYVAVSRAWNNMAEIDDLAVDRSARRLGVASMLLAAAITWAKDAGLPGVRLETQSNNVAACRLYQKMGFELAGFDRAIYRGLDPQANEVALFWYLFFDARNS